ncbi:hypothetical protein CALVIDRAFT_568224 [Calocera viscosa TUFC12733]|uniref:Cytochrome P450 n=1 Tax=Calocera viscosa (strain TUFC12733) TaxID=1330018 RepID=A0A167HAI2_CALVF|nr:hypothetical protein CALVIDRAFT_568224 [Calocera viscosa TUFC12733]
MGTLLGIILALVDQPKVLYKAQEELEPIVDPERLPIFEDCVSLPYMHAGCNEVLH